MDDVEPFEPIEAMNRGFSLRLLGAKTHGRSKTQHGEERFQSVRNASGPSHNFDAETPRRGEFGGERKRTTRFVLSSLLNYSASRRLCVKRPFRGGTTSETRHAAARRDKIATGASNATDG